MVYENPPSAGVRLKGVKIEGRKEEKKKHSLGQAEHLVELEYFFTTIMAYYFRAYK